MMRTRGGWDPRVRELRPFGFVKAAKACRPSRRRVDVVSTYSPGLNGQV